MKSTPLLKSTNNAAEEGANNSLSSESIQEKIKMRFYATISRESLKLGRGRADREAIKEFVKVLGHLNPVDWMTDSMVNIINI